jgi:CRP-like cAMP-binding protein/Fe-S-cluster-containing hydrogenase component 2
LQRIPGASVDEQLTSIASAVPLLAQIPRPLLRELALVSTVHGVPRGHTIIREGDFSTNLYTIVDGNVEISHQADADRKITRHKGEFFGEMALIADRRRSATITATNPSILLEIPRRTVLKLIQAEPSVQRLIDEAYVLRAFQTYLGPDLSSQEFDEVAKKAELKTLQKDEVICRDGDPGDGFYLIRSGSVKISKRNTEGKEYVLTYRRVGEYVGEIALLDTIRNVRTATVTAATRTEVLRIAQDDFLAFLSRHPHLREQLQARATQRALETAIILAAPAKEARADLMTYGVIESTDVLLIDETKCIRCDNCVTACAATHNGQTRLERVAGPSFAQMHVPVSCRHCEGAPCLQDCPPGDAIERDATGVVQIYADKCIGCGNCAKYCPYGVISMVEAPKKHAFWDRFNLLDLLPGRKTPATAVEAHRKSPSSATCVQVLMSIRTWSTLPVCRAAPQALPFGFARSIFDKSSFSR